MVRTLLTRFVSPGVNAASHVAWYIGYHITGGAATRDDDPAPSQQP